MSWAWCQTVQICTFSKRIQEKLRALLKTRRCSLVWAKGRSFCGRQEKTESKRVRSERR